MRTWKGPLFLTFTAASAAVVLTVACGGPGDAKTPVGAGGEGGPTDPGSSAESKPTDTSSGGTSGTTTTTQLDASDLQGAKLQSSTHKEVETKGDGGPRTPPGGRSDEPGRRREDIKTIVLTRRDDARACYDKGLKDHPGIEGDLEIMWTIDPDGNVVNAAVDHAKSQIHEESVGKCIVDIISKIKFAASGKGYETHARYPFNFHPKQSQLRGRDGG